MTKNVVLPSLLASDWPTGLQGQQEMELKLNTKYCSVLLSILSGLKECVCDLQMLRCGTSAVGGSTTCVWASQSAWPRNRVLWYRGNRRRTCVWLSTRSRVMTATHKQTHCVNYRILLIDLLSVVLQLQFLKIILYVHTAGVSLTLIFLSFISHYTWQNISDIYFFSASAD